jgi:hypothetical protein
VHPPLLVHPRPSPLVQITKPPRWTAAPTGALPAATSGHRGESVPIAVPASGSGPWTMLLLAFAAALVVVSLGAPRENWRRRSRW